MPTNHNPSIVVTMLSAWLVFFLIGVSLLAQPHATIMANSPQNQFAGGSGTAEDPYLVATTEHLNYESKRETGYYLKFQQVLLPLSIMFFYPF